MPKPSALLNLKKLSPRGLLFCYNVVFWLAVQRRVKSLWAQEPDLIMSSTESTLFAGKLRCSHVTCIWVPRAVNVAFFRRMRKVGSTECQRTRREVLLPPASQLLCQIVRVFLMILATLNWSFTFQTQASTATVYITVCGGQW